MSRETFLEDAVIEFSGYLIAIDYAMGIDTEDPEYALNGRTTIEVIEKMVKAKQIPDGHALVTKGALTMVHNVLARGSDTHKEVSVCLKESTTY